VGIGHSHGHGHGDGHERGEPIPPRTRNALIAAVVPVVVALAVGMALLWPGTIEVDAFTDSVAADDIYAAEVVQVRDVACQGTDPSLDIECSIPSIELREGPDDGEIIELPEESALGVPLEEGDQIVVAYAADAPEGFEYAYQDRQRRQPLLVLGVLFGIAVIALGRLKGLRALAGVGVSLAVLAMFILPAILEGSEPVLVALVGGGVIAVVALYVSHGVNARSTTALIGAFISLAIVGLLAWAFIGITELSGLADEEARFLQVAASQVRLQGLILAGIVIGTLGVLDDVTVTQVSAVWELHHANPELDRGSLFGAALRIGRDHIASTVNTLVLAYAGASLPLFLLFTSAQQGLVDTANSEVVAVEIVRTLVGSIGLVAAVPITTALAVFVVGQAHGHARSRTGGINDPREHRSRHERWMWGE
jgi:uncharacterized membrane protein